MWLSWVIYLWRSLYYSVAISWHACWYPIDCYVDDGISCELSHSWPYCVCSHSMIDVFVLYSFALFVSWMFIVEDKVHLNLIHIACAVAEMRCDHRSLQMTWRRLTWNDKCMGGFSSCWCVCLIPLSVSPCAIIEHRAWFALIEPKMSVIKLIRLFDKSIPSAGAHCGTNLKLCSLTSVCWRTVALMDNCVACCIWLQLATTLAFHFHNGWDISGYCRRRSVFLNVGVVHKFVEVFYGSSVESVSSHA